MEQFNEGVPEESHEENPAEELIDTFSTPERVRHEAAGEIAAEHEQLCEQLPEPKVWHDRSGRTFTFDELPESVRGTAHWAARVQQRLEMAAAQLEEVRRSHAAGS